MANLGPLALGYVLKAGGAGYFCLRVVEPLIASGHLCLVPAAPQFLTRSMLCIYPMHRNRLLPRRSAGFELSRRQSLTIVLPDGRRDQAPFRLWETAERTGKREGLEAKNSSLKSQIELPPPRTSKCKQKLRIQFLNKFACFLLERPEIDIRVSFFPRSNEMSRNIPAEHIRLKRAYEAVAHDDGTRILIDRLWPRGVKKQDAAIKHWPKELSPSTELRKWFGHDPRRWQEFRRRYAEELSHHPQQMEELRALASHGPVTLVYAAHDELHNDAVVLREVLLRT
jgi:uncharacterized protein YeaO (DUF488 family)